MDGSGMDVEEVKTIGYNIMMSYSHVNDIHVE